MIYKLSVARYSDSLGHTRVLMRDVYSVEKVACSNISWVINERETEADTLWSELHVVQGSLVMCCIDTSFMDYSLQGYWEKQRGWREVLRGEGEKCKVSLPEVFCIIATQKVLFPTFFSLSFLSLPSFFVWLAHLWQPRCNLISKGVHHRSSLLLPVALHLPRFFFLLCTLAKLFFTFALCLSFHLPLQHALPSVSLLALLTTTEATHSSVCA